MENNSAPIKLNPPHSFRFSRLLVTQNMVNQHRSIQPFLLRAVDDACKDGYLDEASRNIVHGVSWMCCFPVTILAMFCLRFSEIASISFEDLTTKRRIQIHQFKTKRTKLSDNSYLFEYLNSLPFEWTSPILCCTYDYVRTQIARARTVSGLRFAELCNDETHIFRHLTASWLSHSGTSPETIAFRLGHDSVESNSPYIHNWVDIFKT